jgi:hypothetical protein
VCVCVSLSHRINRAEDIKSVHDSDALSALEADLNTVLTAQGLGALRLN